MPITNEIFESFRIQERAKEQIRAVRLLARQGYTIIDLESRIINKYNIDDLDNTDAIINIKPEYIRKRRK